MYTSRVLFPLASLFAAAHAYPTQVLEAREITLFDRALLFNGAAFPDPNKPGETLVNIQTFVSLRTPDLDIGTTAILSALAALGVDVSQGLNLLRDRLDVASSIGLPGKEVEISVSGCSKKAKLPKTSLSDLGLSNGVVSVGNCGTGKVLEASISPGLLDSRQFKSQVFSSQNSGFGVISDIDDTIKVSNVLDKLALLKATFLEDPKAVAGMPQLYASLTRSLNPQFFYISGSPYQLYPFLNNFLTSSFSSSTGPLFTRNVTIANIPQVLDFVTGGNTFEYKSAMIERIHNMYPNKSFLLIGDSTEEDPEIYAAAFRKFGPQFVSCIWIRQVDGADNTQERFRSAFSGISKFKVFKDNEIAGLANVNVAGGAC